MKPKILIVVLDLQYVGEKVVAALAREISDEFEVMFCCLDRIGLLGEELQDEGFSVISLNRQPGFNDRLPFKIAQLTKKNKIDIIHAHHYTPYFYSALSRFIFHHPCLIFTEHGRPFPDIVKFRRKFIDLFLNLVTDNIACVCESSKIALIENEGLPSKKISVIYNGIEQINKRVSLIDETNQKVLDWIGNSDKVLGFLARLDWIKNPQLLIDAFAVSITKIPDAKLVVMGKGNVESFEKQCNDLGIAQNVLFAGLVKNPIPVLPKLRCLVVTSYYEAASLSILEAMLCGIPVLATDVGGNPELIKNSKTGYIIQSDSVQSFADAMVRLLLNKSLAKSMGQSAKADATKRFSFDIMVKKYRKMYRDLLK